MLVFFFFFKQKTAYEMRISDWSSDVCSSDLARGQPWNERRHIVAESRDPARLDRRETALFDDLRALPIIAARDRDDHAAPVDRAKRDFRQVHQIGRAHV